MEIGQKVHFLWPLLVLLIGCSGNRDLKLSSPTPDATLQPEEDKSACFKGDFFVLLPEPNGQAGSIRITNAKGSQILNRPGDMTRVEDSNKPPTAVKPLDHKRIENIFGDALSAQAHLTSPVLSFTLWFESDTVKLTDASKDKVPEILNIIKARQPTEIHVIGHTDRVGTDAHNLKLSAKRAKSIGNLLISNGIKKGVLFISFRGESKPLLYTEDEVGEPLNRRVELIMR